MNSDSTNTKRWIVFYPVYINSKKTLAEGRRISAEKSCEDPTFIEIADCCNHLKIPCSPEPEKAYPRDFMQRGRVRVMLKREDGTLYDPSIASRKQLMLRVAELVPRHSGRAKKPDTTSSSSTTASTAKSGKGGKKRR